MKPNSSGATSDSEAASGGVAQSGIWLKTSWWKSSCTQMSSEANRSVISTTRSRYSVSITPGSGMSAAKVTPRRTELNPLRCRYSRSSEPSQPGSSVEMNGSPFCTEFIPCSSTTRPAPSTSSPSSIRSGGITSGSAGVTTPGPPSGKGTSGGGVHAAATSATAATPAASQPRPGRRLRPAAACCSTDVVRPISRITCSSPRVEHPATRPARVSSRAALPRYEVVIW